MSLVTRVQRAREEFTFFYNRGIAEPKRWHRGNSMYFMWSVFPDKDNGQPDFAVEQIWERAVNELHLSEDSPFDHLMLIFDTMERYAKLWSFS